MHWLLTAIVAVGLVLGGSVADASPDLGKVQKWAMGDLAQAMKVTRTVALGGGSTLELVGMGPQDKPDRLTLVLRVEYDAIITDDDSDADRKSALVSQAKHLGIDRIARGGDLHRTENSTQRAGFEIEIEAERGPLLKQLPAILAELSTSTVSDEDLAKWISWEARPPAVGKRDVSRHLCADVRASEIGPEAATYARTAKLTPADVRKLLALRAGYVYVGIGNVSAAEGKTIERVVRKGLAKWKLRGPAPVRPLAARAGVITEKGGPKDPPVVVLVRAFDAPDERTAHVLWGILESPWFQQRVGMKAAVRVSGTRVELRHTMSASPPTVAQLDAQIAKFRVEATKAAAQGPTPDELAELQRQVLSSLTVLPYPEATAPMPRAVWRGFPLARRKQIADWWMAVTPAEVSALLERWFDPAQLVVVRFLP